VSRLAEYVALAANRLSQAEGNHAGLCEIGGRPHGYVTDGATVIVQPVERLAGVKFGTSPITNVAETVTQPGSPVGAYKVAALRRWCGRKVWPSPAECDCCAGSGSCSCSCGDMHDCGNCGGTGKAEESPGHSPASIAGKPFDRVLVGRMLDLMGGEQVLLELLTTRTGHGIRLRGGDSVAVVMGMAMVAEPSMPALPEDLP
jgi:hypothetical protein